MTPASAWTGPLLRTMCCILGALVLPACDSVGVGSQESAILGGYEDPNDSMIVALTPGCTGILIASNIVLTAHHCVARLTLVPDCTQCIYAEPVSVALLTVSTEPTIERTAAGAHAVKQVVPLPDQPEPQRLCGDDLALLVLSEPIAATEALPVVPRVDEEVVAAEEYSAIGFGRSDNSDVDTGPRTRRRRDNLLTQCVGAECPVDNNTVQSREWVGLDETCSGDSGGAALDSRGRLIGVHNRGANVLVGAPDYACSGTSIYNQIFPHADWLKNEVVRLSIETGMEPPAWSTGYPTDPDLSWPIGAACSADGDCPSRHCVDSECTRACNAAAPCPVDYLCDDVSALCARVPPPIGAACSADGDSPSGHCVDSECTRACSVAAPCPADYFCDDRSALCAPVRAMAEGASCAVSSPATAHEAALGGIVVLLLGIALRVRGRT